MITPTAGKGAESLDLAYFVGTASLENSLVFPKKPQIFLSYDLSIAHLGINTLG